MKRLMEVYRARTSEPETESQNRNTRPLRSVALVENLVAQAQGAGVPACVADVVMGEEDHHLASVDAHNFQGAEGRRSWARVEVVDRGVASSAAVDADLVLGAGVAPLRDGAGTLGQGPVGKQGYGWLGLGHPLDLARLGLDRSSRRL